MTGQGCGGGFRLDLSRPNKNQLLCSSRPSTDFSLVTYKDFRDAAPYVGGHSFDTQVSCRLAIKFHALPNVPLFLLFNDADEDFPAQAKILFQKNGASYLDTRKRTTPLPLITSPPVKSV